MNLQALLEHVGEQRFESASRWAWRTAAGTGASRQGAEHWPDDLAQVPHELEQLVWRRDDATWAERVGLAFALYRKMPCYTNLMYARHHVSKWDAEASERFWGEYRRLIGDDDDRLADPVAYSLWCDYFEDTATVERAWHEIARPAALTDRGLERVLDMAGPVPFGLKAPLYERFVADRRWHQAIFRSLLHSGFEYYGDLDGEAARRLLSRLDLPQTTEGLAELKQKLGL
jgi:hypothetical protein